LKNNYILIDYENVQPTQLNALKDRNFRVILFVGAKQSKLPFELVDSMQRLGDKAKYIKINGNGPNALDFHIAFYIGVITEKDKNAYFHVISKDTGFDPLIKHLRDNKVLAQRVSDVSEIAPPQNTTAQLTNDRINSVIARLDKMGESKPRKITGLENTILSVFSKKISEPELAQLISTMKQRKLITTEGEKVAYS